MSGAVERTWTMDLGRQEPELARLREAFKRLAVYVLDDERKAHPILVVDASSCKPDSYAGAAASLHVGSLDDEGAVIDSIGCLANLLPSGAVWVFVDGHGQLGLGVDGRCVMLRLTPEGPASSWPDSLIHLDASHLSALPGDLASTPLPALRSLDLSGLSELRDLAPVGAMTGLRVLDLSGCAAVDDLGPLADLRALRVLKLDRCTALTDLTPLAGLSALTRLSLNKCDKIESTHWLAGLVELESLALDGCTGLEQTVADLTPFGALTRLTTLNLAFFERVEDLSPLSGLRALTSLRVGGPASDFAPLSRLSGLHTLSLSCKRCPDLSNLSSLVNLTDLSLNSCADVTDLAPLTPLRALRRIDLNGLRALSDLRPLAALGELRELALYGDLDFSPLRAVARIDVAPLSALPKLTLLHLLGFAELSSVDALGDLQRLTTLRICWTESLTNLNFVVPLSRLKTLDLNRCSQLGDLRGLSSLTALEELDLSGCAELSAEDWQPIEALPSLVKLEGDFPAWFTSRTLAGAAVARRDRKAVVKKLAAWTRAARSAPERPRLLAAVGAAAGLLETSVAAPILADFVALAASREVPEVDGLFAGLRPHLAHPQLAQTLARISAQADSPLPPETLAAVARHAPHHGALRDATLRALARSLAQPDAPEWASRTAAVLRRHLDGDRRDALEPSVHEAVLRALETLPDATRLAGPGGDLFASIASDHALGEAVWRDPFHARLLDLARAEREPGRRAEAYSALAAGLACASDAAWSNAALDALLRDAATVEADLSALGAAVARAHAQAGRWQRAEDVAYAVAREAVRDTCLSDLARRAMDTDTADRVDRALSLVGGVAAPDMRRATLLALAEHPRLLGDPVGYGALLALLADAPEALAEVAARAVTTFPELAAALPTPARSPVSGRERLLWAAAHDAGVRAERNRLLSELRARSPALAQQLEGTGDAPS
jgi:Leucine-rich repeat (LRR) protein